MAELWRAQRYLQRGYYSSSGSWNNGGKFTVKNSVLRHHSVVPSEGRFRAGSVSMMMQMLLEIWSVVFSLLANCH